MLEIVGAFIRKSNSCLLVLAALLSACTSTPSTEPKPLTAEQRAALARVEATQNRQRERERQQREKQYAVADRAGVDRAAVDQWRESGELVPLEQYLAVYKIVHEVRP